MSGGAPMSPASEAGEQLAGRPFRKLSPGVVFRRSTDGVPTKTRARILITTVPSLTRLATSRAPLWRLTMHLFARHRRHCVCSPFSLRLPCPPLVALRQRSRQSRFTERMSCLALSPVPVLQWLGSQRVDISPACSFLSLICMSGVCLTATKLVSIGVPLSSRPGLFTPARPQIGTKFSLFQWQAGLRRHRGQRQRNLTRTTRDRGLKMGASEPAAKARHHTRRGTTRHTRGSARNAFLSAHHAPAHLS